MDITKQEFEQILDKKFDEKLINFVTKNDLDKNNKKIDQMMERKLAKKLGPMHAQINWIENNMVTKEEFEDGLADVKTELKEFTKNEVEGLALI
jgi:hypothetical protein